MSVQVEKLEKNMAKLTIEVPAEDFIAALDKTYKAEKNRIAVPGFRKGKAPRKMIQKMYGAGIFYEDAANRTINEAYPKAAKECGETIVSRPEIDLVQIEEGKPFIFTAEVALKPTVTLGEYKGLEVERTLAEVSEADVDAKIEKEREQNSRVIDVDDRPVADGDTIRLDFEGFVDGEAFEGGKASDHTLTIGSGSFIPGFEEQLIGCTIGEEKDITVTFPENYQAEDLRGKEAVFKCTVNAITVKELPELDDEFAQDVSEFDTLEEYRDDIRAALLDEKQKAAKQTKENRALAKAVENAKMDIPEPMLQEQIQRMTEDWANRLKSQGLTMEQYMQFTGMTPNALQEQMRPEALRRIQNSLVLEAIAAAESVDVSEDQIEEEIGTMAESYKMEADKLKELLGDSGRDQIKEELTVRKVLELIADAAVEVEPAKAGIEEIAVEPAKAGIEEIAVEPAEAGNKEIL